MIDERYLLDNAGAETGARFSGLEAVFDPATRRHLAATGLGPGWSCWDVGAGGGSVAVWMAKQVGPQGAVFATDVNVDRIAYEGLPRLQVRKHDIVTDPVPEATYDLVHARLVLVHLAQRLDVLQRLRASLKVGGWLVIEDFDEVLYFWPDAETDADRLVHRVRTAFGELLRGRGADTTYPRRLPRLMRELRLGSVGGEAHTMFIAGGSAGSGIERANLGQVGGLAVDRGLLSKADVDEFVRILSDPEFICSLPLMVSAWGRRVD
jgi:SAM-dependent methyltransferase